MEQSKEVASSGSGRGIVAVAVLLYFAEGLPYGLVTELFPLWLRQTGASLTAIGLLSTVSIAWTLKFLWAPMIDRFGEYRSWIRGALVVTAILLGGFALFGAAPAYLWVAVTLLVFASATQDIAIDAYTIVVTPREHLGRVNSVRVAAYRCAIIVAGGGLAALASWLSWDAVWITAAILVLLIAALTLLIPAADAQDQSQLVTRSLKDWLGRNDLVPLVAIALLYRLGDAALTPMIKPFWLDHGFTPAVIGTVTTAIGMTFTILGAFVGGLFVERAGIMRSLVLLGALQVLSNIGYALLSQLQPERWAWYGAAIIETFTGGLGTAAFLAFLMASSDRRHAATDYAVLSGLFALTRLVAGSASGFGADALGYTSWFWITVALGVPGIIAAAVSQRRFAHFADAAGRG